jgi:hypothetical protein
MEEYVVNVDDEGSIRWFQNNMLHRLDGSAVECRDGHRAWYREGKLHRHDGPAIESADGSKAWYLDGERHRLDGPAIEGIDGYKAWYINGKRYRIEKFEEITNPIKELTMEEISSLLGYKIKIIK